MLVKTSVHHYSASLELRTIYKNTQVRTPRRLSLKASQNRLVKSKPAKILIELAGARLRNKHEHGAAHL